MKKLAMVVLISGLLAGTAFAADSNLASVQADCQCGNCTTEATSNANFNTLFPELEVNAPVGG